MFRQRQPREHDERHLDFIRSLPCVSCGNNIQTEAAHIRSVAREFGKDFTGGGRKPDDRWTLPVCSRCHSEQHRENEEAFWKSRGINPYVLALSLHAASGNPELACDVIERQTRGNSR